MPKILNVGGNSREIAIARRYKTWDQVLLDIDPSGKPDIVADARELTKLPAASFDAVYCSHVLEHFVEQDVPRVLAGFVHVLRPDGFADIRVPDIGTLMARVAKDGLDLDAVLYKSRAGPVRVLDVLWGHTETSVRLGSPHFAHRTGFSVPLLRKKLRAAGFTTLLFNLTNDLEIRAAAFKAEPTSEQRRLFNVKD